MLTCPEKHRRQPGNSPHAWRLRTCKPLGVADRDGWYPVLTCWDCDGCRVTVEYLGEIAHQGSRVVGRGAVEGGDAA